MLVAETSSSGPRSIPLDKASFFFLLIGIGLLVPLVLAIIEPRLDKKNRKGCFRVIKEAFMFSFLIRVQQFAYIYFVLVAFQTVLFQPNLYEIYKSRYYA